MAFEIAVRGNAAGAAEQGNGEITQVWLGIDLAELAGDRCPEVFGELMLAVEHFNLTLGIGIGGIDLGEGMQQQQINRGVLLGQDRQHLEAKCVLIVVRPQKLFELVFTSLGFEKFLVLLGEVFELKGEASVF